MTAVDNGGLQGEEKWQQWVVAVAVYGGGLQGEKTLKSVKKQHVFFVFYIIGGGWVRSNCVILHNFFRTLP